MSLKRIGANAAFGLLFLITAIPVYAQDGLRGMQLFDTPELSTVGRGQVPNEGFFVSYDGLYWHISPPKKALIGMPDPPGTPGRQVYYGIHPLNPADPISNVGFQSSSLDTSELAGQGSPMVGGQRIELGRMVGNHGWLLSLTELQSQITSIPNQNVNMIINDPAGDQQGHSLLQGIVGFDPNNPTIPIYQNLPITFNTVQLVNNTEYWSIELMYACRSREIGEGGYLECYAGPRYAEFNDSFSVNALGGNLDATNWDTDAQNHIIAGQVGARYFKKVGRWMFNTEGRFFGGINYQNIYQSGVIGSNLNPQAGQLFRPSNLGPNAFSHTEFHSEFTPGVELRLELRYQLTRAISLRGGWSGTYMDNIARASSLTEYTLPSFGIKQDYDNQSVFVNGVVFGVDINR